MKIDKVKEKPFKIIRATLSEDCRRDIKRIFTSRNLKVDVDGLLSEVEEMIAAMMNVQNADNSTRPAEKRIKQDIVSLSKSLNSLSEETKKQLGEAYLLAYPMPPPYNEHRTPNDNERYTARKVLSQSEKTHFMRMDKRGRAELPVPLDELITRLLRSCEITKRCRRHRRRGAPADNDRSWFTMNIMEPYERFTGKEALPTPNAPFDCFLGRILEDVAGEPTAVHRGLIKTALKRRTRLDPEDQEYINVSSALGNRAASFLDTHVTPALAHFREKWLMQD